MLGSIDPVFGAGRACRRLYPDLPGMGRTPAPDWLDSSDGVLEVLLSFIDGVIGAAPFLLIGHSAGAYLARAIVGRRPEQVVGLALICPFGETAAPVPAHEVVHRACRADIRGGRHPAVETMDHRGPFGATELGRRLRTDEHDRVARAQGGGPRRGLELLEQTDDTDDGCRIDIATA